MKDEFLKAKIFYEPLAVSHPITPLLSSLHSPLSTACILLSILFLYPYTVEAEESDQEKAAAKWITPAAEKTIGQGLRWLAQRQHDDGSFGNGPARGNVAVCGLAGMAFMSGGSTPGRGPYGKNVSKCVDYILANAKPSGFINGPDTATHGPMYGHGFATMFLAECHGMSPRPELRDTLDQGRQADRQTRRTTTAVGATIRNEPMPIFR